MFWKKKVIGDSNGRLALLNENIIRYATAFLTIVVVFMVVGVGTTEADFFFGTPTNLGSTVNSPSWDVAPCISSDGLSLYFQSDRAGGWGSHDIWVTTRETVQDPWGEPMNLGPTVNCDTVDGGPSITANGLELYFASWRPDGSGSFDTWVSTRASISEPWGEPVNLGPTINSSADDVAEISYDGLTAIISTNRSGGYGGQDLWVSTRPTLSDAWSEPVNLGPTVNSSVWDWDTALSADNRFLFFTSQRSGGSGGDDLWLIKRETINDPWSTPRNLGAAVNSSYHDDFPGISFDGSTLYFNSNRPGGLGDPDLWQVSIDPVVDLNADGTVDVKDVVFMTEHWGENYPLCDIGPTPFGDGIVDAQDLIVLANHLPVVESAHTVIESRI